MRPVIVVLGVPKCSMFVAFGSIRTQQHKPRYLQKADSLSTTHIVVGVEPTHGRRLFRPRRHYPLCPRGPRPIAPPGLPYCSAYCSAGVALLLHKLALLLRKLGPISGAIGQPRRSNRAKTGGAIRAPSALLLHWTRSLQGPHCVVAPPEGPNGPYCSSTTAPA